MTTLTLKEKQNIIEEGMEELRKHVLCPQYFNFSDIECGDIEWCLDYSYNIGNYRFTAFTDYGTYSQQYDFDYSFELNLLAFHEELLGFLLENKLGESIVES